MGGSPAPEDAIELGFGARNTAVLRRVVTAQAEVAGFPDRRVADMIAAVNELATNAILHGHGDNILKTWLQEDHLVFEVTNAGEIRDPEAGRRKPEPGQIGGYGLWLVNQLADEMDVTTGGGQSSVRLRFRKA
jgi:anti-sigma regulatory factor (Ser/Thr protein kinase)